MRLKSSSNMRKSAVRVAVAAFLASAATGCSSDASRFTGIFDKDSLTTASIPQRQGGGAYGAPPIPAEDVGTGGRYQSAAVAPARAPVANQGYQNSGAYPVASASPVRAVSSAPIQRAQLAPPTAQPLPPARDMQTRQEAMAQPMPPRVSSAPAMKAQAPAVMSDAVTTGSTPAANGWSVGNAPKVTLRPGETAATLSKRYGVPEQEILKANNGRLVPGQIVVIPTYANRSNPAKMAAGAIDLPKNSPQPGPADQSQKVAVVPGAPPLRDKAQAEAGKLTPPASGGHPGTGSYTVKAGDSLAKIARATNTPIDQLKAMNGITDGNLKVGQTLKVGGSGDAVKTASIPSKPADKPMAAVADKAEAAAAKAEAAQPKAQEKPAAAQTASLSDVQNKMDNTTPAPSSTGIGKYRWPVTGAVIASFGQNVNGSRNDGIDISVPEGTPIKAAENGVVIYAGNGLKQLGNTVLIRHDDGKVTVYGHASNISVSRGQKIQRGQTIATSGMSGDAKRPQVHFEVRKDASPVNPSTYLE